MVYLIGGSPRCGKSLLAHKIGEVIGATPISIDTVSFGILNTLSNLAPETDLRKLFPNRYLLLDLQRDQNTLHSTYSAYQIRDAHLIESHASWAFLKSWIFRELKQNPSQDLIFEGYQLLPEFVSELELLYPKMIKTAFLIKTNPTKIFEGLEAESEPSWSNQANLNRNTKLGISTFISLLSDFIQSECDKHLLQTINTENNFVETIEHQAKTILADG